MWVWRRMERVKWTDKIKNAVVLGPALGQNTMMSISVTSGTPCRPVSAVQIP